MKLFLIVCGDSHAHTSIDVIEAESNFEIQGIEERARREQVPVPGYLNIGIGADLLRRLSATPSASAIDGQIKSPAAHIENYGVLLRFEPELISKPSPVSYVSEHSSIGEGTIIFHESIINALASAEQNCIINSQVLI